MLDALQDFASSMTVDETLEGLKVEAAGVPVTVTTAKLGLDAKSDKGRLQAAMDFGMDGIGFGDVGLGAMQALIPRQVALRPSVSNVDVAALTRMLQAMSEKKDPAQADIAAMFAQGGLVTGLDSFSVDMGGARFKGQGKVTLVGPSAVGMTGTAQIVAEKFDALMQTIQSVPELAQGVPVMVFAKGIGRTVGDTLVWDVSYQDGKALVNGVDLTAMAGGGAPSPGGAPKGPPQRQQRPQR